MKIRRLLEVDLACLTSLHLDDQWRKMHGLIKGRGIVSLNPMRSELLEIMNAQPPMFRSLAVSQVQNFSAIEDALVRKCKRGQELQLNLQTARILFDHFRSNSIVSQEHDFGKLPLGIDRGLQYWVSAFYGRNGVPVVTFIDPRGGHGLTEVGREVVFSVMHAAIRERDPAFAKAQLEIIQLPYTKAPSAPKKVKERPRALRIYANNGAVRYSFGELDKMFTRSLNLWDQANAAATADRRRQAGGKGTLL